MPKKGKVRMRKTIVMLLSLCFLLAGCAKAEAPNFQNLSAEVFSDLEAGDWQALYARSAEDLRAALGSQDGYRALWEQLLLTLGAFEKAEPGDISEKDGFTIVHVDCVFSASDATIAVAFDADGFIAGVTIASVTPEPAEETESGRFLEEEISLPPGADDESAGRLTLPDGAGPFPAVIMLHGSGSSDMNESLPNNAPFRDLAHGLAERGVASVRYDKYPYAHPDKVGSDFTVETEYMLDAVDAARLLLADARIGRIYLLGHSMGAMLAPRAMERVLAIAGDHLAGGVLLAGTPLHLWQVQHAQNLDLIAGLEGAQKEEAEALVEAELAKLDDLRAMPAERCEGETFFGISACYQLDEMSVDPAEVAAALNLPLFIAQGGKDWQVRPENGDELWRARLPESLDISYHRYDNMNHLLSDIEGEPTGTTADYMHADAQVSEVLIEDIAKWILSKA